MKTPTMVRRLIAVGLFAVLMVIPFYLASSSFTWDLHYATPLPTLFLLALAGCVGLVLTCMALNWRSLAGSRSYLMLSCTVCLALTFALGAFYFMEAFRDLANMHGTSLIQADNRHPYMIIATRDVDGIYNEGDYSKAVPIRQWERCALSGTQTCSESPRIAYMRCQSRQPLSVSEKHWGSFAVVPRENAPGVEPIESVNLCDAD
ncbi:MAG: hypothetical protein INH06_03930 [Cupriavidus sp.]|nr:hypothetical protein [Cupriavidus sp.]